MDVVILLKLHYCGPLPRDLRYTLLDIYVNLTELIYIYFSITYPKTKFTRLNFKLTWETIS